MKTRKGQASMEYIFLIAGGLMIVLIVGGFIYLTLFAPSSKQVVSQGSIVQQQFGSLSKAMEKGKPLTYQKPTVYEGLAEAPATFEYGLRACVESIEFWSNVSGVFELTKTIAEKHDPEVELYGAAIVVSDEINQPGFYEFNVRTCACEGICEWIYADENGTQVNQVIEIVPHADPRFVAAKQRYFNAMDINNRLNPNQGPIPLEATASLSWACDLPFPLIEGSTTVRGDALQSIQLTCNIGGRQIQSAVQNIQQSGQYRVRIADQNAQGQSTCFVTACNSTDCMDSQHKNYDVCQVQVPVANPNPTADFVVLTLTDPNTLTFNYNVGGTGNAFTAHAIYAATNRGQIQEVNREDLGEAIRGLNSQSINVEYGLAEVSNVFGWYVEVCNENNNCMTSNMRLPQRN